jgi:hypothetical protein
MSDTPDKQLSPERQKQQEVERQRQLQVWAASRVKLWGELQKDDYDFRDWAKDANKNLLQAGAVYEYARESRKLRGLLVLMNPKRPREAWEMMRPGSIDGRRPEPGEIESYPAETNWLPCSFDDLNEHDAERALGGFLYSLRDLADYLADNISFGVLFRTRREELEKTFGGLNELARLNREFRYFLPVDDAVEIAAQSEAAHATVEETVSNDEKRIIRGESCSEVIAVRIRWRFTDSEIVTALKRFLDAHRPRSEAYKARQRKKGSRRDSVQAALDCLSAMRLASHFRKTPPRPSDWRSVASSELKESAIGIFDMVRLGGRGDYIEESNFDALIIEARELFLKTFPFGESAENAPTLKDRAL